MDIADSDRDSESFVRSFARGLKVIEAMGRSSELHTVASVAAATELPRTVVRRILMTLTELGYSLSDGKTFRLTPKVLTLGMTYLTSLPFWGLAQHVLESLSSQVKESVALSVFDGQAAIYVLRIPSREIMSLQLGVGSRVPAYATSPGRVLLAWQPKDQLQKYLASTEIKLLTRRTVTDKAALLKALDQVREDEYSWVDGEFDTSVCGLSVPVRDAAGEPVAALSVNLLSGGTTQARAIRELLRPLRAAAEQLRAMAPQFLSAAGQTARLAGPTPARGRVAAG
jgi:IclR family transcriptional regulator, pca regulon regulatory protein